MFPIVILPVLIHAYRKVTSPADLIQKNTHIPCACLDQFYA